MFQGGITASGRSFDNGMLGAAHRTYPFGTVVRVTNLRNARSVNVTIVDRGPYGRNYREGAIIDVSQAAAEHLDFVRDGQVEVHVEVLRWGDGASTKRD
jgi:rare lipoprotein A